MRRKGGPPWAQRQERQRCPRGSTEIGSSFCFSWGSVNCHPLLNQRTISPFWQSHVAVLSPTWGQGDLTFKAEWVRNSKKVFRVFITASLLWNSKSHSGKANTLGFCQGLNAFQLRILVAFRGARQCWDRPAGRGIRSKSPDAAQCPDPTPIPVLLPLLCCFCLNKYFQQKLIFENLVVYSLLWKVMVGFFLC